MTRNNTPLFNIIIFPPTKAHAWFYTGLWTTLIFSTLSIVRSVVNFLKMYGLLAWVVGGSLCMFALLGIYLVTYLKPTHFRAYVFLGILCVVYIYALCTLTVAPEEKIHFIEYGFLTWFVWQALSFDVKKKWLLYVLTFCTVSFIGWLDEVIQYFLPSRVYDIRDIRLNILSAVLMLIFLAILKPSAICSQ